MQVLAIVVSLAIALVGIALFVKAIRGIVSVIRLGQPAPGRNDAKGARWGNMLKETLAHTRMLQWTKVGVGHWFVFVGFGLLFFTLLTAFGQLFDAHFVLPLIGDFFLYEWVTELFTVAMVIAIVAFIGYRATRPSERERGPRGRFFGSTMWQGYFVEFVILGVGLCILLLRGAEYALLGKGEDADHASAFHFPLTFGLGETFSAMSVGALENFVYLVAMVKIVISFTWMIVLSLNLTMGVAWHRFSAWFNIWFKRESGGGTALGALQPMMSGGKPINFEDIEEMDEDTAMGVGRIEDFSWKDILDFTSCTECGRCQSQCPAWNTEKPLSPKLLITGLRDHAYAKAPYLLADEGDREGLPAEVKAEAERELVGATEGWAWDPSGGAVIDPDVLWSCTSCGACVQQCPVDIEHVDHIVDMRRYQILVESSFPSELNGLFKGLENKGNPWNMAANARLDWAKGLPFDVKVVGEDLESLDEVDWLFWVGCAGAYEDRAKKTTRAVAELLDTAGVSFGVLGNGETCTGDPARRSGNEFVFQGLAAQNAEVFKETKAKQVVTTCAHCFNTLRNEYADFGVELEVVHHTQLLNRLVREGRLTPVPGNAARTRSITYHDPCYLGRHNQVYSPPRELLGVLPDARLAEMPRNSERSFCCGAGGARMWMEETIGERINLNRTTEAIETGADQIATACPFCRVMLSDGLTAKQADGSAREEVEVLDVAQLLLASVKGETARTPAPATAPAAVGAATTVADRPTPASAPETTVPEKTVPEKTVPEASAPPVEDTVAPARGGSLFDSQAAPAPPSAPAQAAPASSGGSLFDTPASPPPSPASTPPAAAPSGGSLFDTPAAPAPASAEPTPPAQPAPSGGSLFDVTPQAAPAEPAEPTPAEAPSAPVPDEKAAAAEPAMTGGSLFDVQPDREAARPAAAAPTTAEPSKPAAKPSQPAAEAPAETIASGGSLFDVQPMPASPPEVTPETAVSAEAPAPKAEPRPAETRAAEPPPKAETSPPPVQPAASGGAAFGGSLFDIQAPEPAPARTPPPAAASGAPAPPEEADGAQADADKPASDGEPDEKKDKPASDIASAKSLFDL